MSGYAKKIVHITFFRECNPREWRPLMSSLRNPATLAGNIDIPWLYRTKFQAWPSRLMTNAPSHAGGGNRNASTSHPSEGDEFDQLMGFGADADQSTNCCLKATGHSYSTDLVCSSLALPCRIGFFNPLHTDTAKTSVSR